MVAADAPTCSELGRDILKKNGSAVDSAVATLFCIGVINMHSAGIGGGGFMVIYSKAKREVKVYDYREQAPGMANETMYVNNGVKSKIGKVLKNVKMLNVYIGRCAWLHFSSSQECHLDWKNEMFQIKHNRLKKFHLAGGRPAAYLQAWPRSWTKVYRETTPA